MSSADELESTLSNRKQENIQALVTGYLREIEQSWFDDGIDTLGGLIGASCLKYYNHQKPSHITITTKNSGDRSRVPYTHCPQSFNSDVYRCRGGKLLYFHKYDNTENKGAWRIASDWEYANPKSKDYGLGDLVSERCGPEEKYEDDEFDYTRYYLMTFFWEYLPQGYIKSYPNV